MNAHSHAIIMVFLRNIVMRCKVLHVIIVYVRFLETLLKDLTSNMKFSVIMKQFWLSFAMTKNRSEIISANFFSFFKYCNYTLNCL